ncbi:MAG: V-type ATP synthase subunit D [Clostridiaceae bacterium]|nr:V-type ATP synthase subunit D [Clostridiaceae bacterium]
MARLNVSPMRMVMTELKGRLTVAVRGHKLLKDKQDELMRQFIELIKHNLELRKEVETELASAFRNFMLASAVMSPEMLEQAVSYPHAELFVKIKEVNRMSVRVPQMEFVRRIPGEVEDDKTDEGQATERTDLPYGFMQTSADLDYAIEKLDAAMERLLELAQIEKTCQLLADDIESTRRRVNALEYRTIPDLEETIKYIRMKLEENERATITRLMKVKEMIAPQE